MHFLLLLAKAFLASLGIRFACLHVEWKILENEMFSGYHLLRQPSWNYIESVQLGYLGDCPKVPRGKKRLRVPLTRRDLKQLVQPIERNLFHSFDQLAPLIRAYTHKNEPCLQPSKISQTFDTNNKIEYISTWNLH